MKIFFWIIDLLIPMSMVIIGLIYRNNRPKEINQLVGYRTVRSMKSEGTWEYANRRMRQVFIRIGCILFIFIVLSKLFTPITQEYLSLIHTGVGIISMFIPLIFIEKELKTKFDENGIPKENI